MTTPADIDDVALSTFVAAFVDHCGVDLADAAAVRKQCETMSLRLARFLSAAGWRAAAQQVWMDSVPAALAENDMAPGHFVCVAWTDAGCWTIDLTAAQFAELFAGPRFLEGRPAAHY